MKSPCVIAAVLAFSILSCAAQETAKVALRLLSFPKALEAVKVELRLADGKSVPIEAPSHEISKPLAVASTGVWAVGETVQNPEGEAVFQEYGRTNAVASPEQLLLLIRKGDANSDGFDLIALDGRFNTFGGGRFLFMNAAKVDIAGEAGGVKFAIKPGAHKIIEPKADQEGRTFHAMFYFRKGDEAKPFFSSRWPVGKQVRCLVFFYHDPKTMQLRMHTIRDLIQGG